MSNIHEECGVFGVISPCGADVAGMAYYGLYALQHRGQESCGIVVNDDGVFSSYKDLGLVSEVFSADTLSRLPQGNMAVGHVRYGTTGANNRSNCQPIEVNHQKGKMALAHNGNLSNAAELRNTLELSGAIFHTTSGRIVKLLREAGAKEIHMRLSSPPFLHPCYYGTDSDSQAHLIACHHNVEETAEIIGADSLGYLPVSKLHSLIGGCGHCSACFDGDYPTAVPTDTRKDRFEQKLSEKERLRGKNC